LFFIPSQLFVNYYVNEWNEEEKKEHNGMNKVNGSVVPFFSLRFTHTNSPQRSVV